VKIVTKPDGTTVVYIKDQKNATSVVADQEKINIFQVVDLDEALNDLYTQAEELRERLDQMQQLLQK
jgi:hypothetical protein